MRLTWICLTLLLAVGLAGMSCASDDDKHLQAAGIESWIDVADFFIADLDGDGSDELFRLFSDYRTYQANPFSRERLIGPALYQGNATHTITSATPIEADTLPGNEVALVLRDDSGDSLWVEVHRGSDTSHLLCRTKAILGNDISDRGNHRAPGWDGSAGKVYCADLNDDGQKEIILPLTVGFDMYPRGIYVFAYPSGRMLWSFPLAGNPLDLTIADANDDGFKEMYFKTWSCANGARVNNRVDTAAYVFSLDHLGNQLWISQLGDRFDFQTGNVHVCDCDNDGIPEIYYTMLLQSDKYDRQVRILEKHRAIDNAFLKQQAFDVGREYREILSDDFDGDGLTDLLLDGSPSLLNPPDLSTRFTGPYRMIRFDDVFDLEPAGKNGKGIVLHKTDSLYVVGSTLEPLLSFQAEGAGHILRAQSFVTPFGRQCLAVLSRVGHVPLAGARLDVYHIHWGPAVSGSFLSGLSGWLWIIMIAVFGAGIVVGRFFKCRLTGMRRKATGNGAQYADLQSALGAFAHGQLAARNLNRLLFLFSNLPDDAGKLDDIRPNLKAAVTAYSDHTRAQLHNIADLAYRIKSLRSQVRSMRHSQNLLDNHIDGVSIGELTVTAAAELKRHVPAAVKDLTGIIARLTEFMRCQFTADLVRVIPSVLSAFADRMRREKVVMSQVSGSGLLGRAAYFSEAELAAVIEELLTNACTAMAEAPVKELKLFIDDVADEVIIRISDTGTGLGTNSPEQVFTREYTTKGDGGGYGLYHARQQVERFGGRIRIADNDGGPGSTVELYLKTVSHE